LLLPLLAGSLFTLVLNSPMIISRMHGDPVLPAMGTSVDEAFYFSLINNASLGVRRMGNVSLLEHRDNPDTGSYAPLIQGGLKRLFGWDIATAVWFGDVVFPFVTVVLLSLAFASLFPSAVVGAGAALLVSSIIGTGFLRSISPQVTLIWVALYLWAFLGFRPGRGAAILRGTAMALLFLSHSVTLPFLLGVEGLALLFDPRVSGARRRIMLFLLALLPLVPVFALKLVMTGNGDPVIIADTYRRMGMIASHLPAAPLLQMKVLAAGIVLLFLRRFVRDERTPATLLLILCGALLLALNQSIVHGIDIVFGLYYERMAQLVLPLVGAYVLFHFLRGRYRFAAGLIFAALGLSLLTAQVIVTSTSPPSSTQPSDDPTEILTALGQLPGERVVLAPYEIADLVPAFTRHAVAFNHFAHYQYAGDGELAQRYLLHESFFPISSGSRDDTYPEIFSYAAGNIAARERTLCRGLSLFMKSDAACRVPIRDRIAHQELLPLLDHPAIDQAALFQAFHVDTIVTDRPLPAFAARICSRAGEAGGFTLWSCPRVSE